VLRTLPLVVALQLATAAAHAAFDINEGELHFLTEPPAEAVHHHHKRVVITPESLKTGWIVNRQCHYNLDQVGAMEVVFAPGRVRALDITRAENIESAWVEGSSVQLKNVGPNAVLCLNSENRVLTHDAQTGHYTLTSGPYMRRFLDGYFPMRVSLNLEYPAALLSLVDMAPTDPGLKATRVPGQVRIDTLFEGRLLLTLRFSPKKPVANL
jgi:hypothetical protein